MIGGVISILTFGVGIVNLPSGIFAVVAGLIVCPIITKFIEDKMNFKFKKYVLVIIYICIMMCSNMINNKNISNSDKINNSINSDIIVSNSVWSQEITPLKDFKYSTNENEIYISKYQGESKK